MVGTAEGRVRDLARGVRVGEAVDEEEAAEARWDMSLTFQTRINNGDGEISEPQS